MAETGDPNAPDTPQPDHGLDEAVGFASPASLAGRSREVRPAPPPEPEFFPEPEPPAPVSPAAGARDSDPELVAATREPPPAPGMTEAPAMPQPMPPPGGPTPAWARETPRAKRVAPAELEGASGLFAVYALILFAVPTLGVSAVIALLAVTGRPGPTGDVAASHFVFQQRTLWAGGVVALAGAILVVVGLGVFVLFLLAVWLILRGAAGVLKLKAGRAMPNPRGWLV